MPSTVGRTMCYCIQCFPEKLLTLRYIEQHLNRDKAYLADLSATSTANASSASINHVKACIARTQQSLEAYDAEHQQNYALPTVSTVPVPVLELSESHAPMLHGLTDEVDPLDRGWDQPISEWTIEHVYSTSAMSDTNLDDTDDDEPMEPIGAGVEDDSKSDPEESPAALYGETTEAVCPGELFTVPEHITNLRAELKGSYQPGDKPKEPFTISVLSESEKLSLRHYIAWRKSNGTVSAFNAHRRVLQDVTEMEILSLHRVRGLALEIAKVKPLRIDMCPNSCIAYTGSYSNLEECPYIHGRNKACRIARFRMVGGKKVPQAQVAVLPILPSIHALFANKESSYNMRYRDRVLQQVLKMVLTARDQQDLNKLERFSDFANGMVHQTHRQILGLFEDPRHVALTLSSDGAQLTMKKQSNTWISILILLNLPPKLRYLSRNIIINMATPGPNSPADIESFLRPMYEELAIGSEGLWMWDAWDSAWFFQKLLNVVINGDMLGSAKSSGMSGHSAAHGDRFSMVQGARTSTQPGSKYQYYPLSPPDTAPEKTYNPSRPTYNAASIPMRTQEEYWATIDNLSRATTQNQRDAISRRTGVSRIPLAAASPAFIHPVFFPLDPFHLFYENCMPWFWDLWTTVAMQGEPVCIPQKKVERLGSLVADAMKTLPPSFCGNVRDPYLKRQSQYKAFEWMALLHWYILPIGLELGINFTLLQNFARFVYVVEFSMTVKARSQDDLSALQKEINTFYEEFELLYVAGDPEKIQRCRLCVFQLIHIPAHIRWFGSIRLGSQAPVERAIGEMGHKIHSKKEPFAELANVIIEKEVIRIVELYHPSLSLDSPCQLPPPPLHLSQPFIHRHNPDIRSHLAAVYLYLNAQSSSANVACYGKLRFGGGQTLRSRLSESTSLTARKYRWFEVCSPLFIQWFDWQPNFILNARSKAEPLASPSPNERIFGEALAFYAVSFAESDRKRLVAVYTPIVELTQHLRTVSRGKWPESGSAGGQLHVIEADRIRDLVGIWEAPNSKHVYILRKHPSLLALPLKDRGLVDSMDREVDDDDD